jgi:hypothetical protein
MAYLSSGLLRDELGLTGASSLKWINVEAPKVSTRRVDLLGELPDGNLVHIELQSRNEKDFPLRMVEYLFGIGRQYGSSLKEPLSGVRPATYSTSAGCG